MGEKLPNLLHTHTHTQTRSISSLSSVTTSSPSALGGGNFSETSIPTHVYGTPSSSSSSSKQRYIPLLCPTTQVAQNAAAAGAGAAARAPKGGGAPPSRSFPRRRRRPLCRNHFCIGTVMRGFLRHLWPRRAARRFKIVAPVDPRHDANVCDWADRDEPSLSPLIWTRQSIFFTTSLTTHHGMGETPPFFNDGRGKLIFHCAFMIASRAADNLRR